MQSLSEQWLADTAQQSLCLNRSFACFQACFPANALVTVEGKGLVTMQSLAAGDQVLSIDRRGNSVYDTVYFFGHHVKDSWTSFCSVSIQLDAQRVHHLLLTPTHFLPVGTAVTNLSYKYAKHVSIGDNAWMVINDELHDTVVVCGKVIGMDTVKAQGLYNPYTEVNSSTSLLLGLQHCVCIIFVYHAQCCSNECINVCHVPR